MARKKQRPQQVQLPPAPPGNQFEFNQEVTLKSDSAFRGYVFGKMPDGSEIMISIKEPGSTGKRGCKFFPAGDVTAVYAKKGTK